jgi:hypothetical protein
MDAKILNIIAQSPRKRFKLLRHLANAGYKALSERELN